jgi:hypothetical protein
VVAVAPGTAVPFSGGPENFLSGSPQAKGSDSSDSRRLVKTLPVCQFKDMSFAEIKEALPTLSPEQRAELEEQLHALDEGVTVEQLHEINAMLDEEINDPSTGFTLEQARERISRLNVGDAAQT